MARFATTIRSPRSPADAFAYMADLRNFAAWDPGVRSVAQVQGEGGGPGAVFDVEVVTGRRTSTFRYVTTEYSSDSTVVVEARTRWFTSLDRIAVVPAGSGSAVTYDAELRLNGPARLFDVALAPMFRRIGERAEAGLVRALDGQRAR